MPRNRDENERDVETHPVIAARHYGYLKEDIEYIRTGIRGNSHPDMVKAIRNYTHKDIEAVADYLSRLPDYRVSPAERNSK